MHKQGTPPTTIHLAMPIVLSTATAAEVRRTLCAHPFLFPFPPPSVRGAQPGALSTCAQAAFNEATYVPRCRHKRLLPAPVLLQASSVWKADAEAASCADCGAPFTELVRRHHCRFSGSVVCGLCSKHVASLGWVDDGKPVRVSDASYNALVWAETVRPASNALPVDDPALGSQAEAREEPAPDAGDRPTGPSGELGTSGPGQSSRAEVGAQGGPNEAINSLHQRGEKLAFLQDRVEAMQKEAESFYDMASKTRRDAERKSKWFG